MMNICTCGGTTSGQHAVNCPLRPTLFTTLPPVPQGWQCPRCGGGVAPGVARCPCVANLPAPTWGSSDTVHAVPLDDAPWKLTLAAWLLGDSQ